MVTLTLTPLRGRSLQLLPTRAPDVALQTAGAGAGSGVYISSSVVTLTLTPLRGRSLQLLTTRAPDLAPQGVEAEPGAARVTLTLTPL